MSSARYPVTNESPTTIASCSPESYVSRNPCAFIVQRFGSWYELCCRMNCRFGSFVQPYSGWNWIRELSFSGSPAAAACAILSALEGAMLTSRAFGDDRALREAAQWLLGQLTPA